VSKRISSADPGYQDGHLSVFPKARDNTSTLFIAANNATTVLKHSISQTSRYFTVESTSGFPNSGILKLESPSGGDIEFVYYGAKVANQFHHLQRGYSNKHSFAWGSGTLISLPVVAEQHNALKDAIINIQKKIGIKNDTDPESLESFVRTAEEKWLKPRSSFRAFPKNPETNQPVQFKTTAGDNITGFLWDFGDNITSTEKNPVHIYREAGSYTVTLSCFSDKNAQSRSEKQNYINVGQNTDVLIFYANKISPKSFEFVDQSIPLRSRFWDFGDGNKFESKDPDDHYVNNTYKEPGFYTVVLTSWDGNKVLRSSIEVSVD
jgi:PKD repeat protein